MTQPLERGQTYHIYNRGNNRENIFREQRNYAYFLALYTRHIVPIAHTYAYCLLKNHFHFLVTLKTEEEIVLDSGLSRSSDDLQSKPDRFSSRLSDDQNTKPVRFTSQALDEQQSNPRVSNDLDTKPVRFLSGSLDDLKSKPVRFTSRVSDDLQAKLLGLVTRAPSQAFGNFFNAYTKSFNRAYERTGALFERPFQRRQITSDSYFQQAIIYIHQNPQQHGFVDDFRDWPYTSYPAIISDNPTQVARQPIHDYFGGIASFIEQHQTLIDDEDLIGQ